MMPQRITASPGTTKTIQAIGGATRTMLMPHRIRRLNTRSRCSSGVLATVSAPLVENGLESTTDEEIDSAMIRPTAPTAPVSRNGTASGISAPRMPVVEANADTTAPT